MKLTNIKIVVAEDEPELRKLLCGRLAALGAGVFPAKNGLEAFAIIKEQTINLVISDIRMPGIAADGITLLKNVRAQIVPAPPFILLSGFSDFTAEEVLGQGAAAFFTKPFNLKTLDAKIGELLQLAE